MEKRKSGGGEGEKRERESERERRGRGEGRGKSCKRGVLQEKREKTTPSPPLPPSPSLASTSPTSTSTLATDHKSSLASTIVTVVVVVTAILSASEIIPASPPRPLPPGFVPGSAWAAWTSAAPTVSMGSNDDRVLRIAIETPDMRKGTVTFGSSGVAPLGDTRAVRFWTVTVHEVRSFRSLVRALEVRMVGRGGEEEAGCGLEVVTSWRCRVRLGMVREVAVLFFVCVKVKCFVFRASVDRHFISSFKR